MEYKSAILDFKNKIFKISQNSEFANFCSDSLFFKNIDNIIFGFILATIVSCAFFSSNVIGAFAFCVIALVALKLFIKKGEELVISKMDIWIVLFYLVVFLSLCASSLFVLSLKGFIKTVIYIGFYFSAFHFILKNKNKILPVLTLIALLVSFESIVGIIQNSLGILEISGWQDTSRLDVTEVLSRCYGTLKPYNPNLLAGFLIAGMPSLFAIFGVSVIKKNKKRAIILGSLYAACALAIVYTGCRGAYLALFACFLTIAIALYHYTDKFSIIKKRYKSLLAGVIAAFLTFIVLTPSVFKRIISIFAMRADSSTSFRLNVYQSALKMFFDNPFLGIGVGNQNFREIYGLYMRTGFDALACYSVPLEIAVESGIFALISFTGFITVAVKKCIMVLKESVSSKTKVIIFSILLMLIGTMVHGLFDTVWFRPQVQIIFWLNIAILNTFFFE